METASKGFFVTAIHTDSGKTVASAILSLALKAAYWKPVQCGLPADTDQIKEWLGDRVNCFPERFRLKTPASPHFAAHQENVEIQLSDFNLPEAGSKPMVVEGAGGLLVPLSDSLVLADLMEKLGLPVVLVINHYLGALNHGLLTIREIQRRNLKLAGIIFNGEDFQEAEPVLLKAAGCPCLLRIPPMDSIRIETLIELSQKLVWKN